MVVDPRIAATVAEIDWQDDGFGGGIDDVSADIRSEPGVSVQRGKDAARARSQPMVASADVTLDNRDHRYTSENAGSDLYPYVLPDRPLRIGVSSGTDLAYEAAIAYNADATYYQGVGILPLFTGLTEEPQESHAITSERHVQFRALGRMALLKGAVISTPLYSSIRTDTAIGHVLDAAGWSAADRVLSIGDTTINFWWVDNQDAWTALMELLETEGAGASIYEDGNGKIHFENRLYRASQTRSTTAQATFDTVPSTSNAGFTNIAYTQNAREIYNDVFMTVRIRFIWIGVKVWHFGETMTLGGGETRTIIAHLDNPIDAVTTPTVTTDYVVTSGSLSSYTATLLNANTVVLTFIAGGGGVVLDAPASATTGPQLRANELRESYEERAEQTAAPSPLFANRQRSLNLNEVGARAEISQPTAQALCDAAAAYYGEGRPTVSFEIVNRDSTRLDQIIQREISDRVHVDAGANEFAGDAWIEQLNYQITTGGRVARCGIVASRASSGTGGGYVENPALWDMDGWDEGLWGN